MFLKNKSSSFSPLLEPNLGPSDLSLVFFAQVILCAGQGLFHPPALLWCDYKRQAVHVLSQVGLVSICYNKKRLSVFFIEKTMKWELLVFMSCSCEVQLLHFSCHTQPCGCEFTLSCRSAEHKHRVCCLPVQDEVSEDSHLDGICILMPSQVSQDLFVFVLL